MYIEWSTRSSFFFFFNDTATTEIYTLSLHDALPICRSRVAAHLPLSSAAAEHPGICGARPYLCHNNGAIGHESGPAALDRKSTRLNSSHANISYAVFCLKKKTHHPSPTTPTTPPLSA